MNVRQLEALLAVIETGTLNKAARQLRISQPALTKGIQRLEAQLGVPLFVRDKSGMRPTPYADMLQSYAEAATSGFDQIRSKIDAVKNGHRSNLVVAGAPLLASILFPKALVKLKQQSPNVQIRIVTQSRNLIEGLVGGEYELAVTALDEKTAALKLNQHFLFNDRLVVATRPGHPLARAKKMTPELLQGCQWIYSGEQTWHRDRLERYFREAGIARPPAAIECRAPAVQKAIIACSDQIGLVTQLGMRADVAAGLLKVFEIDSPLMARPIGFLWKKETILSAPAKQFVQLVERLCRDFK